MLIATGCASVNPKPAFDDVQKRVEGRIGASASWIRGDADSQLADQRLVQLLGQELTAERAVQVAFLASPSLQGTLEELGIAQADYAEAASFSLGLEGKAVPPSSGVTELSVVTDVLGLALQPLRRKIGSVQLEQAKLRVAQEMLDVAAETKKAFHEYQARSLLVKRLELILDINRAAADLAKRQYDAGNINDLDLANQAAAFDQARVELAHARAEVRADRERLNRLMGLWGLYTEWKAVEGLPEIPTEDDVERAALEATAIRQRFDVAAARYGVDLVGRALALKKGTRFLPVGIEAGVEVQREFDTKAVGPVVGLQLPLFDLGRASVDRLDAQHRQARRQLEAIAVNARSQVREARDRLTASREQALFYRNVLLPQRVHILDLTLRQYNMMLKGPYDLLLARQAQVDAERAYVDAWREYWIARADLDHAMGGGVVAPPEGVSETEGAKQ
jgi:cobalt-zinc-cadmium efflux system outer membrane protein